ncbi:DUF202 domain-containing protein [Gordonia sp. OPL2]|uniref:DUF202 domain-containing protein n=1 Tax=Gordonia sp. OPL2 TaxID=2486274 RepID=UPI0021CC79FA|nr:DUF202 domain-containing protein [Gordonia sp. OPL2]
MHPLMQPLPMHPLPPDDPGLQAERTSLSWTRTSLAIMANGVLVVGRDLTHHPTEWGPARWLAAGVAATVAAAVYAIGRRRCRDLERRPLAHPVTGRAMIIGSGIAVVLLTATLVTVALA